MTKIRTRFAPSPTGFLHIGGLRTALFNYLFAKQNNGEFILRIEDTDQQRLVEGAAEALLETLDQLGLKPDGKVEHQSQRLNFYKKAADKLLKKNLAYPCFCSSERLDKLRQEQQANKQVPKYDGHCRHLSKEEVEQRLKSVGDKHVIRFKIPEDKIVEAEDIVYGKISVKSADLDDFVLIKTDNYPTYHLANIVDDYTMGISHVIRGEEWLPSFPKHVLLYQALGYPMPQFVHLPLLLNPDKSKLSKRQGDVAVEDFLAKGYLPEALINYVTLLGWNPGNDQELFLINQLIEQFSLEKINKAGAVFDVNKLNWFNAEYIRRIIAEAGERYQQLIKQAQMYLKKHEDRAEDILKLFGSRINHLSEISDLGNFLFELPKYSSDMLVFKKSDQQKTNQGLSLSLGSLAKINTDDWQLKKLNQTLEDIAGKHGLTPGDIFWPVRVALSGQEKSPSPSEILETLGKEESLNRIKLAINKLK
jgi:glutamyl-tRNA synthetase